MLFTELSWSSALAMASAFASLSLATMTLWRLRAALRAHDAWQQAFESSTAMKRLRALEQSTADLSSQMDDLLASHKSLRSRIGMRELRGKRAEEQQPETKAQARARIFGAAAGPAFATAQLEVERGRPPR
jgi:hypothetical protein